jgi:hypothetical protein
MLEALSGLVSGRPTGGEPTGGEGPFDDARLDEAERKLDLAQSAHDLDEARRLVHESLAAHPLSGATALLRSITAVAAVLAATDPPTTLGLPAGSSCPEAELKRAYKARCFDVHPDRCAVPGAEEAFKAVQEAFATLSGDGGCRRTAPAHRSAHPPHGKSGRRGKRPAWDPTRGAPTSRNRQAPHLRPETNRRKAPTPTAPKRAPERKPPKAQPAPPTPPRERKHADGSNVYSDPMEA